MHVQGKKRDITIDGMRDGLPLMIPRNGNAVDRILNKPEETQDLVSFVSSFDTAGDPLERNHVSIDDLVRFCLRQEGLAYFKSH